MGNSVAHATTGSVTGRHAAAKAIALVATGFLLGAGLASSAEASFAAVGSTWLPLPYQRSADAASWTQSVGSSFNWMRGVAYGNNVWVAVGAGGQAFTSPNAHDWTPRVTGAAGQFYGIAHGTVSSGTFFAAVGPSTGGVQTVYTTTDGVSWNANPTGIPSAGSGCAVLICIYSSYSAGQLFSIAHGNPGGVGKFVAVGSGGIILTSTDGQVWMPRQSGVTTNLFGVAWSGSAYVAVGYDYLNYVGYILRSTNGENWSVVHTGQQYQSYYNAVGHGNGRFLVAGYPGLVTSTNDGLTWTAQSSPVGFAWWMGVTHGNGRWVLVSSSMTNGTSYSSALATSTDGTNWSTRPVTTLYYYGLNAVSYGNGQFAAVGYSMARSPNGLDWIHTNGMAAYYQYAVASNGATWVAAGFAGALETSPDGRNWTARYSGISCCFSLRAATYGAGTWVVVGDGGKATRSTNGGTSWEQVVTGAGAALYGVGFRPGQFVAVGAGGTILRSEDGSTWSGSTSGLTTPLRDVEWGGTRWVAVGDGGRMLESSDGTNWNQLTAATSNNLNSIAYDAEAPGDKWVAVGAGGTVLTSADGLSWSAATSGTSANLLGLTRGNGLWVAVGPGQSIRSADGSSGSWAASPVAGMVNAVASTQVPPVDCLPKVQSVGVNENARVFGGGGRVPYTWTAPGASSAGPTSGALTVRTYAALGSYNVYVTDAGNPSQSASCVVHVVTDPPPPPPPPPSGPQAGCGYVVTTSATDPNLYEWTEIDPAAGGGGTPMPNMQYYFAHGLQPGDGFSFNLCGTEYSNFWLAASGHICMSSAPVSTGTTVWYWSLPNYCGYFYAQSLPNANWFIPKPAVFGLWTLLNPANCPGGSGTCMFYKVEGTAPDRVLIYEFKGTPIGWSPGNIPGQTFQIKLHEGSDCLEVHYQSVASSPSYPYYPAGAGYQDGSGALGYQRFLNAPYSSWSRTNDAWRACPFKANADAFNVNEDQPSVLDVTENDVIGGAAYSVTSYTTPELGTLVPGPGLGEFTYTPFPDAIGEDAFSYTVTAGTSSSTATVRITLQPVNDAPTFEALPGPIRSIGGSGPVEVRGFATSVAPGPPTAEDEAGQIVAFQLSGNTNPSLFAAPPALTIASDGTGTLRFTPAHSGGESEVCFRAVDNGGTATVTDSWGETRTGVATGPEECVTVLQNAPPVAYFEPSSQSGPPGHFTFDSCPAPAPRCTHDGDGTVAALLWEFGDGGRADGPTPTHAFGAPGRYDVRLTAWDTEGASSTYSRAIEVILPPGAPPEVEAEPEAPLAEAGPSFTVLEGSWVQLAGSQRGGGDDARFQWAQETGPPVQLSAADQAVATFTAPLLPGTDPIDLQFSLRVRQGDAESAPDYVSVRVVSANNAPVADAGGNLRVSPGESFTLDAGGSHDPDGDAITVRWTQVPTPGALAVAIAEVDGTRSRATAPSQPGTLSFLVTVSDGKATSQDTVTVVVEPQVQGAARPLEAAPATAEPKARIPTEPANGSGILTMLLAAGLFLVAGAAVAFLVARRLR